MADRVPGVVEGVRNQKAVRLILLRNTPHRVGHLPQVVPDDAAVDDLKTNVGSGHPRAVVQHPFQDLVVAVALPNSPTERAGAAEGKDPDDAGGLGPYYRVVPEALIVDPDGKMPYPGDGALPRLDDPTELAIRTILLQAAVARQTAGAFSQEKGECD